MSDMPPPPPPTMPPMPPAYAAAAPMGEPPLWAPYYGASMGVAISRFFRKYATFSGRASRSEFWWWYLVYLIFVVVVEIISAIVSHPTVDPTTGAVALGVGYYVLVSIVGLVGLAVLVPTLAVTWRRLHDTGRSGGWYFIGLIPFVGGIILIVFLASGSNPAGASYDQPTS